MSEELYTELNDRFQSEAYRLIRHKSRDFLEPCTNEQLGEYVRGIVDLQSAIYASLGDILMNGGTDRDA